ncbi:MAG: hypothetical protein HY319_23795 [Armatimonadetes bacterium]|nr:hypothetical protein [Armatimonadota bacterium]
MAARQRVQSKYLRATSALAGLLDPDQAIEVLRRGIEISPTAEGLYCELLHLYRGTGRQGEAAHLYRSLCEVMAAEPFVAEAEATL